MFQFRRFPAYAYLIQRTLTEYCSAGFPHSEICGSKLICSSPQLIAACHVLLRLLMPRHSPCALSSLTFVGASSVSLVSALRRSLARSAAPPLLAKPFGLSSAGDTEHGACAFLFLAGPLHWALLGESVLIKNYAGFRVLWLHCFTHSLKQHSPFYLKVPQHLLLPSVACFALLSIYIVQFSRCTLPAFLKTRSKHLIPQVLRSDFDWWR